MIAPDLRGHGQSSAPHDHYDTPALAQDVIDLCAHLDVHQAFFVGHSMGGNVCLNLAPKKALSLGCVLIDSLVFASAATLQTLEPLRDLMRKNGYLAVYRQTIASLFSESDDQRVRTEILDHGPSAPQHVLVACLDAHFAQEEFAALAARSQTPLAYIGAAKTAG